MPGGGRGAGLRRAGRRMGPGVGHGRRLLHYGRPLGGRADPGMDAARPRRRPAAPPGCERRHRSRGAADAGIDRGGGIVLRG